MTMPLRYSMPRQGDVSVESESTAPRDRGSQIAGRPTGRRGGAVLPFSLAHPIGSILFPQLYPFAVQSGRTAAASIAIVRTATTGNVRGVQGLFPKPGQGRARLLPSRFFRGTGSARPSPSPF